MSISLKIVLVLVVFTYILCILHSVKKKNMRISYLIIWMNIGLILILAFALPNFVEDISKLIGFEMPINMIFSVAIFVIIYLIFNAVSLISKQQNKIVMLIQEISILKKRVEELEKNNIDKKD